MNTNLYQFRLWFIFYAMTATFCVLAVYSATDEMAYQKYVVGPVLWAGVAGGFYVATVGRRPE